MVRLFLGFTLLGLEAWGGLGFGSLVSGFGASGFWSLAFHV